MSVRGIAKASGTRALSPFKAMIFFYLVSSYLVFTIWPLLFFFTVRNVKSFYDLTGIQIICIYNTFVITAPFVVGFIFVSSFVDDDFFNTDAIKHKWFVDAASSAGFSFTIRERKYLSFAWGRFWPMYIQLGVYYVIYFTIIYIFLYAFQQSGERQYEIEGDLQSLIAELLVLPGVVSPFPFRFSSMGLLTMCYYVCATMSRKLFFRSLVFLMKHRIWGLNPINQLD